MMTRLRAHGTNALLGAFARHARRAPRTPALRVNGCDVSYGGLAAATASFAGGLEKFGIGPGDVVGLTGQRSAETIAFILAIVARGAAYLPLDPDQGDARLVAMIEAARPRLLVADPATRPRLPADFAWVDRGALVSPNIDLRLRRSGDLAYVLFTSGSTGEPKGVAMRTAAVAGLIEWHRMHPRLGQPARTLQFASTGFDVSFQEIFSTLATGGCLVLPTDAERRDPWTLLDLLRRERVERVFLPYVALQALAEAAFLGADAVPDALLDVLTAGEQLRITPALRAFFFALPDCVLHNHYGPTETHVVTAHELNGEPSSWPELPSIGLPLPHVRVRIARQLSTAPDTDDEGELLLGGNCLAAGYAGRPDLTARGFVELDGEFWYRTGDCVRSNASGELEYVGRLDQQVKIAGHRVEPAEIEAVLYRHEQVAQAAVVAQAGATTRLVAHIVPRELGTHEATLTQLLASYCATALPKYMTPQAFALHSLLPTTASGKVDRRALARGGPETGGQWLDEMPLETQLANMWLRLLGLDTIDMAANLFDLGARSLTVVHALTELRRHGHVMTVAQIYEHPSVAAQAALLESAVIAPMRRRRRPAARIRPARGVHALRRIAQPRLSVLMDGVAIIGMAGRFPGAETIDEYWRNLLSGQESITRFDHDALSPLVPRAAREHPRYVAARGVIADADRFDAAFFGIAASEALLMDPQQRVFMELCWNALEHAGIDTQRFPGSIGVYAGVSNNAYRKLVEARSDLVAASGEFAVMLAGEKDYVATRVAHRIGLNGPAISLYTACSTSLVAVTQAWYSLMTWQCDAALAGGISIAVPQESGYVPVDGGMESADGYCRPFDAAASGTLFSSGGGVIVLKRLADAIRDRDMIWAVIRGVGVNNDGADKASFTAPSANGQAVAVRLALATAEVSADSISYVEAHGTGTQLGDPIEVEGLTRAFREQTQNSQYCWLGSVKSNIGHLVAGSGAAGLIKAVLALHHEQIPPTLNYRRANPEIDFDASPFKVADRAVAWPRGTQPRRAGISSFGVGGTNAHVIIEEAPPRPDGEPSPRSVVVLPLSARDEPGLQRRAADLAAALGGCRDADLPDVGWSLATGRRRLPVRGAVVAGTIAEAQERLRGLRGHANNEIAKIIFLFPGQGSQHVAMARELIDAEPAFASAFDRCCELASPLLGRDLRALILPGSGDVETAKQTLARTSCAQPALFAVEYALCRLWQSWGVEPHAMIGHSVGELVAACIAGVFSLEDAMRLVVARGAAMDVQPPGAMLAVRCSEAELGKRLPRDIEIAAVNAPDALVVAGAVEAIDEFARLLDREQIASKRLDVSHAFHSASMDGALPSFRRAFDGVRANDPTVPFYSCVTGQLMTSADAASPDYWCRQIRAPVRFGDAAAAALAAGECVALEVGPGQALAAVLRANPAWRERVVTTLGPSREPGSDAQHLAAATAQLWCLGAHIDWDRYCDGKQRRRVPLPGYPFRGQRYWIDPVGGDSTTSEDAGEPTSETQPVMAQQPSELRVELRELFAALSGEVMSSAHDTARFLDLGLDSLALTQAALEIERRHGSKVKFRRLMEDLDTIAKLASFLEPQILPLAIGGAAGCSCANDAIGARARLSVSPASASPASRGTPPTTAESARVPVARRDPTDRAPDEGNRPFGAAARITLKSSADLDRTQEGWLHEFITRYCARTAKSKAFSERNRASMADPRVVTGFNPSWKELVYPLVVERSSGAHLWDIDGNRYIDLLNAFGANFLGYQPGFIKQALAAQIEAGFEIGPQHPLTADVTALIREMTGMDRVAFCNTGSEAVMGAMRIARTVTGRKTIVIFRDSYHGIFDEVIVRGTRQLRSIAAAPGILASAVENILVLDYGSDEALEVIGARAHELAAVMIEPVQARNPTLQPREFIGALRRICDDSGCALIFDEVITGFRICPGGAQEFFGVRADIATYGKIIGGGLPLAAIAGSSRWLDALDGGEWRFGDDSRPEAGVTYFAGTFVRHPLALAAAKATLLHLRESGPQLQRELNARTTQFVARLNAFFDLQSAPMKAEGFASLWRIRIDADQALAELFYHALRERGLHVYAQFNCFLTTAHGAAEIEEIVAAIESATAELLRAGILSRGAEPRQQVVIAGQEPQPAATALARQMADSGDLPDEVPLTDAQTEKWLAGQFGDVAAIAFNESQLLELQGQLNVPTLERAITHVVARHEAFATSFAADGSTFHVGQAAPLVPALVDLEGRGSDERLRAHCAAAVREPFDLASAPLARIELIRLAEDRHALLLVAHHLIFDGWSAAVFFEELASTYKAMMTGQLPSLPAADSFRAFARAEHARRAGTDARAQLEYWKTCSHRLRTRCNYRRTACGPCSRTSPRTRSSTIFRVT